MRVDFSQQFKNLDGTPIEMNGQPLTLKTIATEALNALMQGDESLSFDEKSQRGKLARKIYESNGEPCEISVEQLANLKPLVGRMYAPPICAQVDEMIEGSK